MRKAAAILLIASAVLASSGQACTIVGQLKKAEAKTVYFSNGEKVSVKQLKKTGCKLSLSIMSASDLRVMKIADLKKKLRKLGVK